jgi:rubredoxin
MFEVYRQRIVVSTGNRTCFPVVLKKWLFEKHIHERSITMKKWRCTTCGYIHKGETPPDQCPVCKMHKSMKPGALFVEVK